MNIISKLKKRDLMKIAFILVGLFLVFGIGLYFYGKLNKPEEIEKEEPKILNTIEKYGYYINENASEYYKKEFEYLKELTLREDVEEKDIVTEVAKLYVIDLLSLNNKLNKYEVTSTQYYYSDKQTMHNNKVIEKFYNLMEDNAFGNRKQELPEVSEVEVVDVKQDKYILEDGKNKNKVDSYVFKIDIKYVKELGYDKKVEIILVKESDKYSVVSYKPTK